MMNNLSGGITSKGKLNGSLAIGKIGGISECKKNVYVGESPEEYTEVWFDPSEEGIIGEVATRKFVEERTVKLETSLEQSVKFKIVGEGATVPPINGDGSYILPIATKTTLGGVKIGNNLSIDSNGVLSATTSDYDDTELNNIKKTLLISYVNENTFDVAEVINELLQNSTYLSFEGLQEINIKSPIIIQKPNTVLDLAGCKIIADVEMENVITTLTKEYNHIYNVIIQNGEIDCNYKTQYGIYTRKAYKTTIRNIRIDKYKTGLKLNDVNMPNGDEWGYSYETLVDNVICGNIERVDGSVGIEVTASDSWIINSVFGGEIGLWSHDNAVNFYSNIHNWNTGQKKGFMFQNTVGNIMCNIEADDSLECGLVINNEYNKIQNYTFQVGATTHPVGNTLNTSAIKILQGNNYIDGMTVIIPNNAQIQQIFENYVPNRFLSKNIKLTNLMVRNNGVIVNDTVYRDYNINSFSTSKYYSSGWKRILKFDSSKFNTLDGWNDYVCGRWMGKIIGDGWAVSNVYYAEIVVSFAPLGLSESGVKIINSNELTSDSFRITIENNVAYLEVYNNRKEHFHIIPTYSIGVEEIKED